MIDGKTLLETIRKESKEAKTLGELDEVRVKYIGRAGVLTNFFKNLSSLSIEEKKIKAPIYQNFREEATKAFYKRQEEIKESVLKENLAKDCVDATLPLRGYGPVGGVHPLSQVSYELIQILLNMGFAIADAPEVETDYYNFTALNIPEYHPARQDHDTFYMNKSGFLLRTQTSPIQIRAMGMIDMPIKVIAPGRVFRADSDATHVPNFHQIEGLCIGEKIDMGYLKGCLLKLCRIFFESEVAIRFRPSFFPFTEPSAEVDISLDGGKKWLEVLGCGMVHPNVLKESKIDASKYQGFAFGLGVERFAMLKYNIPDLRDMYKCAYDWLEHFNFGATRAL